MSKKNIIIFIMAAVLIAAPLSYTFFFKGIIANAKIDAVVKKYAGQNAQIVEMYSHVKEKQAVFDKNKNNGVEQYLSLGFSWKSLADQIQDPLVINRALQVYEDGILKFNKQNSILYLNAAGLWRQLGNYEQAEKRYLQALELDPGDTTTQLTLIEMYKREMKKPPAFVKARYALASKAVINQFPIAASFAAYTRELGEYDKSLEFYKVLYNASHRPEFKRAIDELQALIQKSK